MEKCITQVKKGVAAFFAVVLVLGSGVVAPQAVYANEPTSAFVYVINDRNVTMAITENGELWAWGSNKDGLIGDGTATDRHSPVKIMDNVASLTGSSSRFAIKTDGSLWAWGDNGDGQLGDGTTTHRNSPVKIMENVDYALSANRRGTFAIKTDGSLWAWGMGILGDGKRGEVRPSPVKIMDNVASVSNYEFGGNTYAIQTDGSLWEWGSDYAADEDGIYHLILNPVKIMDNVVSVSAQSGFAHAIQTDGSLWAWGSNRDGLLGDGTNTDRRRPIKIMENVASLSVNSGLFAHAIQTDGSLWAWGSNTYGKLGDGTTTGRNKPVMIMQNVASIIKRGFQGGYGATFVIQADGSLWGWGWLTDLKDPVNEYYKNPVRIMENVVHVSWCDTLSYIQAIQTDGSLWEWSKNSPVRILENVAYAADDSSFAIKTDGSLWAWGNNYSGQLGDGTTTTRNNPVRIGGGNLAIPTQPAQNAQISETQN